MPVAFDRRRLLEAVDAKPGNITEPKDGATQGTEEAPGEDMNSVVSAHGPASEVNIKHDSAGTHVTATHPDGHVHKANFVDKERGYGAMRTLSGLDEQSPDQVTEDTKARAHPIGPKEKERLDKEGGIHIPGE